MKDTAIAKLVNHKFYMGLEFILLFFGIPLFIYLDEDFIHPTIILLPIVLLLFIYLKRSAGFHFRELIRLKLEKIAISRNLWIFLVTFLSLFAYVYFFDRTNLFNLPKGNPQVWIILSLFYPVFSAYLQEIIYRTFLFRRYAGLFQNPYGLILASSVTFSFAHITYYSAVSMILTFILGLYLSYTYHKTGSVLFTSILHGVYGVLAFSIGLGHHFWLDMFDYLN